MSTPLSTVLFAVLLLVSTASGLTPNVGATTPCADQAIVSLEDQHVHLRAPRLHLWEETNELPGLQTVSCTTEAGAYSADTFVQDLPPQRLGILGVCSFFVITQCL